MGNPPFTYERLGKILQGLPKEGPPKDFDQKFWRRFELEKDLPVSAGVLSASAGYRWALSAAVVVSLAFFFVAKYAAVDKPSVEIVQGQAYVRSDAGDPYAQLPPHHSFTKGQQLKTGEAGWVLLELENGYQIKLNPNSEILVKELKPKFLPGKTVFYLKQGETLVSIGGPSHIRYPLEIVTPNAFARAMGTQFMVRAPSALEPGSQVSVLNGTVQVGQVVNRGQRPFISLKGRCPPLSVTAGKETWISEKSEKLSAQAIVENTRGELEELFQFSRKNQAILLISMSPGRSRELLKPCVIYIRIQSSDEKAQSIAAIAQDIQEASESADRQKHLEAVEALENAAGKQSELDPVPLLLFTGAYYAYLEEYEEAARVFSDVSLKYPYSHFASLALMAEAHLRLEKLNDRGKAGSIAQEILKRYPDSYESREAEELLEGKLT